MKANGYALTFTGENTLTPNNEDEGYQVVLSNTDYDGTQELVKPTGTFTLTGAEGFVVYPYIVKAASWAAFTKALADGASNIVLARNIAYDNSYDLTKDVTIDLNGKTLEISTPGKMLNFKANVSIKNGNLHSLVYAQSGNVTLSDINFGGNIAYVGSAQGVITVSSANVLVERCNMKNVKNSGTTKPRSLSTEGRSSGSLIFRDCDFKNSNLDRPYINPLNNNAALEITNCALYSGASNIDLGASYVWSNLNLTGCTGGFTFTISRKSTSLTEEELSVYRAIKSNNSGSKRFIFSDGEKNNL